MSAEARVVFGRGGSPALRVIEAGLVDRPALDEAIVYLTTPTSIVSPPTLISAWAPHLDQLFTSYNHF
jgi:hypothetical protein